MLAIFINHLQDVDLDTFQKKQYTTLKTDIHIHSHQTIVLQYNKLSIHTQAKLLSNYQVAVKHECMVSALELRVAPFGFQPRGKKRSLCATSYLLH